jgi:hypothetical protein
MLGSRVRENPDAGATRAAEGRLVELRAKKGGVMAVQEILAKAGEGLTAKRVFGEPYEKNGLTIITAARLAGGGGGGENPHDKGAGGGFGGVTTPSGAYVIEGNTVTWKPAVDVNRIVLGMQLLAALGIVTIGSIARERARRRSRVEPALNTIVKLAALRRARCRR